jgi:hypothetical protein
MHGVHVVNQKINLGAMELTWEVNLPQMFLKQRNQKRLPCVSVNKQKIHPIAMARMLAYK